MYQGGRDTDIPSMQHFIHHNRNPEKLYTENYLRHWMSLVRHYGSTNMQKDMNKKRDSRQLSMSNDFDFLIYNMHENHNVLKTLYCNVLSTQETCKKYSHDMQYVDNVDESIDYDRLIIAASKANKIHGYKGSAIAGEQLNKAVRDLEKLWEEDWQKTVMDFPRDCLSSSEVDNLFEKSMKWEKLFVPEYYKNSVLPNKYQIERDYRSMAKDKFCSVNVDKVVHDTEYSYLWNGLNRKRNGIILNGSEAKFGYKWSQSKPMYISM